MGDKFVCGMWGACMIANTELSHILPNTHSVLILSVHVVQVFKHLLSAPSSAHQCTPSSVSSDESNIDEHLKYSALQFLEISPYHPHLKHLIGLAPLKTGLSACVSLVAQPPPVCLICMSSLVGVRCACVIPLSLHVCILEAALLL